MKKLESSITNMVLVLVGVALVTGGILAYVNNITQEPIKNRQRILSPKVSKPSWAELI